MNALVPRKSSTPARDRRRQVLRMTLAFQIWQFATPRGWDVDLEELCTHTRRSPQAVARILHLKGWRARIRPSKSEAHGHAFHDAPTKRKADVSERLLSGLPEDLTTLIV
ncbi:hypothetical protein AQS8620_01328 [Aquimixticola soesokkakensis]|uniref:Uncharacterized protein n=1 Tax=Aquimixticola soesokkakensis TaxID=1519096 RepID=A0A1Y5SDU5_9RHOB|nr:hypothetical protein [Aquimixticola soesokkakensis]SLN36906.1 hypothetical protein AQS8620_01328 [Aquimixticola soesokkakensis]